MIKGSALWKEVTMLIIIAVLLPVIAWSANAIISRQDKADGLIGDYSNKIMRLETQQIYNDKQFSQINSKLDVLLERSR